MTEDSTMLAAGLLDIGPYADDPRMLQHGSDLAGFRHGSTTVTVRAEAGGWTVDQRLDEGGPLKEHPVRPTAVQALTAVLGAPICTTTEA